MRALIAMKKIAFLVLNDFSFFRVRGKAKKTMAVRGYYQASKSWDVGTPCHMIICLSRRIHTSSNGTSDFIYIAKGHFA